jgi:serine/threonine protein kinase
MVGPYLVDREIGRGGMGRVFLATDTRLHRSVALKLLPARTADHPGQRERLRREARAAAVLSHPGICTIYALEEIDNRLLIVSEYVQGHSLREEISGGRPPAGAEVERAAVELSEALAHAHQRGITHRDLKPENIMRAADGRLKILDFGLALIDEATVDMARLTVAGAVLGTPAYMAPEQLRGESADSRSDVFSLGIVLHELATGVHPFDAPTPVATAARVLESAPPRLADRRPDLSPRVAAAIDRALAKTPADRFASAAEMRASLTASAIQPVSALPSIAVWWRRHQMVVIGLYLIATVAAWQVKEWVPGPPHVLFPFVGILAVVGALFRGHLLFAEWANHAAFPAERLRAQPVTLVTDVLLGLALLADGGLANGGHEVASLLVMAFGVSIALARVVIERSTSRSAFGH